MFGLDDAEVTKRRRYVGRVRREIQVRFWTSFHSNDSCHALSLTRTLIVFFARVGYESGSRWYTTTLAFTYSNISTQESSRTFRSIHRYKTKTSIRRRRRKSSEPMGARGAADDDPRTRPDNRHHIWDVEHSGSAGRAYGARNRGT
jgi:hypothetical protein